MSKSYKGCVVAFDHDIREDDIDKIVTALCCIRGVAEVELSVADTNDWMARQHVKAEIRDKLFQLFREIG